MTGTGPSARAVFAVSVYAEWRGISRGDILAAMPHSQYGEASYESVTARFEILPTTIIDHSLPQAIVTLQPVHFDIVLEPESPLSTAGSAVEGWTEEQVDAALSALQRPVRMLLDLFKPRQAKPSGREVR